MKCVSAGAVRSLKSGKVRSSPDLCRHEHCLQTGWLRPGASIGFTVGNQAHGTNVSALPGNGDGQTMIRAGTRPSGDRLQMRAVRLLLFVPEDRSQNELRRLFRPFLSL